MKQTVLLVSVTCASCGFQACVTPRMGSVYSERTIRGTSKSPDLWICTDCMEEIN